MKVIALQDFTNYYVSMEKGDIADINDTMALCLINKGYVKDCSNTSPLPQGKITITQNGNDVDIYSYATADINVAGGGGAELLTLHVTFTTPGNDDTVYVTSNMLKIDGVLTSGMTPGGMAAPIQITGTGEHTIDVFACSQTPTSPASPIEYKPLAVVYLSTANYHSDNANFICEGCTYNSQLYAFVFNEGVTEASVRAAFVYNN